MKLPAFQFYPGDWRKDPGVQSLNFHDRGVWLEIICLMHESSRRGLLLLNNRPMPESAISRLLGIDEDKLRETLETLLDYGVASKCPDTGALMCRRMVRDQEARGQAKINGAAGGNPKLTTGYNSPGFVYAIRDPESGHIKIGIASNYKLRISKIGYKLGRRMETLLVVPVDDMGTKEAMLHAEFASRRVHGEWFRFPDDSVDTLMGKMKGINTEPDKGKQRASSSSSSSTSSSEDEEVAHIAPPKFAEVEAFAKSSNMGIGKECVEAFWDEMEALQWTYKGVGCVAKSAWQGRFRRFSTNWINNERRAR